MSDYFDIEELKQDFFLEADEQLEMMEKAILVLEESSEDRTAIDEVFRAAHTLKGSSGAVEMTEISGFTHVLENLLDFIREDKIAVDEIVVTTLLNSLDILLAMVTARKNGEVYSEDVSETKNKLVSLLEEENKATSSATPDPVTTETVSEKAVTNDAIPPVSLEDILPLLKPGQQAYSLHIQLDKSNPMISIASLEILSLLKGKVDLMQSIPAYEVLMAGDGGDAFTLYIGTEMSESSLLALVTIDEVTEKVSLERMGNTSSTQEDVVPMENREAVLDFLEEYKATKMSPEVAAQSETVANPPESSPPSTPSVDDKIATPETKPSENKAKPDDKKAKASSDILKVDNKRVNMIMNLTSEGVINKAALNQFGQTYLKYRNEFENDFSKQVENIRARLMDMKASLDEEKNGNIESDLVVNNSFSQLEEKVLDSLDEMEKSYRKGSRLEETFKVINADIERNIGDLHEAVLHIRMVPIEQLFTRYTRLVRDLSKKLNKPVDFIIEGGETELDKTIVEELIDPLMHCVRNSMDHGLEDAETRANTGKPAKGTLRLVARNQGDSVVVEISDDGAGLNKDKILAKAIKQGLVDHRQTLSDNEIHQLILKPGFSTAEKLTDLSGRGVGLDVVKSHIEKLKGTIKIETEEGCGTTFIIKLPLTLAIIRGLLICVQGSFFVIPVGSVVESLRASEYKQITVDGEQALHLRDEIVRIVNLSRILNFPEQGGQNEFIVVIESGENKRVGLIVDELIGEEDIVIKPLDPFYGQTDCLIGATILGDGTVALILDGNEIFKQIDKEGS